MPSADSPPTDGRQSVLEKAWRAIRKWLCQSVIPYNPFNAFRVWAYRRLGFRIGQGVFIGMRCYLDDTVPSRIVIEDDVTISYQVSFATHGPRMTKEPCILRKGCYIGTGAIIFAGVEIGRYATLGAGSLANRSVPAFSVAAGVPARVIRRDTVPWASQEAELPRLRQEYDEWLASREPTKPSEGPASGGTT